MINFGLPVEVLAGVFEKIPVVNLIPLAYKAFDSMPEDQKVQFIQNLMIMGAKAGAVA